MNWLLYVMLGGLILLLVSVAILAVITGIKFGVWARARKRAVPKKFVRQYTANVDALLATRPIFQLAKTPRKRKRKRRL